jgi:uncharacterized protein YbcI
MARFEQEYMGRGPKDIHAHLIGDLLLVRLQGVLTAAEQQLAESLPAGLPGNISARRTANGWPRSNSGCTRGRPVAAG